MNKHKLIDVYNEYIGFKKFKIFYIFGVKIKVEVNNAIGIRNFAKTYRIKSLENKNRRKNGKVNFSIVAIYKNEPDLIEWIEYHKLVGVQRFYLYDNESSDNSKALLEPYIDSGEVIYHYVQGKCKQLPVYKDAIYHYKNETNWLAIIDLDEYIVPVEKNDINEVIEEYEDYPALGVNWIMFDSNDIKERPKGLVIENYTKVQLNIHSRENKHIKSIVNPRKVKFVSNPHYCIYKNHELAVDENFKKIGKYPDFENLSAMTEQHSSNKIRINHYHTKSCEDYCRKRQFGFADSYKKRPEIDQYLNFKNRREDKVIFKYIPKLKKKMEKTK